MSGSLLRHWHSCHSFNPAHFVPWYLAGQPVGWLRHDVSIKLYEAGFLHTPNSRRELVGASDNKEKNTELLQKLAAYLHKNFYPEAKLWGENYDVKTDWRAPSLALIDRAVVPWLGVRAWGIHVNGYVIKAGQPHLWIGRRSPNLKVEPGKLDNIIAGGQPTGLTLQQNLQKEAAEEAGMAAEVAAEANQVTEINYIRTQPNGLRRDTIFVYDLELPENFVPQNRDGEMAEYFLWPAATALDRARNSDDFKFNVNLVIIDFCLRHRILSEADAEYNALKAIFDPTSGSWEPFAA